MSAVAVAEGAASVRRSSLERLVGAIPLLTVFFWLCLVYAWQAWMVSTPWLFTDELEYTQLARSLAETGEAARRGDPYARPPLSVLLMAPAWLISNTEVAYQTAKYIGVVAMTAAIFPVYGLARMLVRPRYALFAATGAVTAPAFMYSGMLLQEPLAYTLAATAFYLIVRGLATLDRRVLVLAAIAAVAAPLARAQLAVIPVVFAVSAAVLAWQSDRARGWRAWWSGWERAGAAMLLVGVVIVVNTLISHRSLSWGVATLHYKDRMLELGSWATGALTIGLGVLPVVVGLAALARPKDEERTPELRAFVTVTASSVVAFGLYTAVKAAYISTIFATRWLERNLIYLVPLLFVATALWLERPRLRWWALAMSTAVAAYLLTSTPYELSYPYFEAPGFAILAEINRSWESSQETLEGLMLVVLGVALAFALLPQLVRSHGRLVRGALGVAAVLVLGWTVAAQISATRGSITVADELRRGYREPPNWVDRATGGRPVLYLGQGVVDPNWVWLTEFWNRSVKEVWSIDDTAPGPGPTMNPDVASTDGRLHPARGYPYALASGGIELVGDVVDSFNDAKLYRIEQPLRLRAAFAGVHPDGWMSSDSTYSYYERGRPGWVTVGLSRAGWAGVDVPSAVDVRVGTLVLGPDKHPAIGRVTAHKRWIAHSKKQRTFVIRTPPPPFHVHVHVAKTFVPRDLDPTKSDPRQLGVVVSYAFSEKRGR